MDQPTEVLAYGIQPAVAPPDVVLDVDAPDVPVAADDPAAEAGEGCPACPAAFFL
jgi:hypothetical protein